MPPAPVERYVGLDIGKHTELCEIKQERVTLRATIDNERQLEKLLGPGTARARVVYEACREGWYLYDLITSWGHEVWMVDTTRARQLGIGQHKRKNDRIDAETLARAAEAGRVPTAHVLSHDAQLWRLELGVRRALVETRAQYVTTIRSILRSEGLSVPSCDTSAFLKKLEGVELPPAVRELIEPLVVALQTIGPQIDKVDAQLDKHSAAQPVVQLLSSVPGVGRIVAAAFISVIDNPGRFRTAHQVEAYLGLVPSESTSGKRKLGAITKQGNSYLRAMLTQAAWQVQRQRGSDPLKSWGKAVSKRRGKRVGVIAVARRLAGILWAIWRHNRRYDPSLLGQASARGKRLEAQQTRATACAIDQATDSTRRA
jgi:transposase